jgi:hypothetical protein
VGFDRVTTTSTGVAIATSQPVIGVTGRAAADHRLEPRDD